MASEILPAAFVDPSSTAVPPCAMPSPLQDVDMWLVDSLVIPTSLHDVEGRLVRVNEVAERASGKSNTEWAGHHFTEPLPPEARESVAAHFRRAVERCEGSHTD
jgi:PAS domain-containing protein